MAATIGSRVQGATDLEWGVVRGIAGFRWLALAWATTILVLTRAQVGRPALGIAMLLLAFAVTAVTTVASIRRHPLVFHPVAVALEVAVGVSLLLADGAVYTEDHSQSLGSSWPLGGVLMAAVIGGPWVGGASGVLMGAGKLLSDRYSPWPPESSLSLLSSGVLYSIAGYAAGGAIRLVRAAETAVAQARAREEVSRTLHDGVLQTLAVVQRRSTDRELAALAREQELDLRSFLAGDRTDHDELGAALRHVAARVERRDGLHVQVLFVDDDHPTVAPSVVAALSGAVGEALTNATKHGRASRATVFVDVDDEVFCSVKDDGAGFDPDEVAEGLGTTTSIRGRLDEVAGHVEISSRPGQGVEVRLRAPLRGVRPR